VAPAAAARPDEAPREPPDEPVAREERLDRDVFRGHGFHTTLDRGVRSGRRREIDSEETSMRRFRHAVFALSIGGGMTAAIAAQASPSDPRISFVGRRLCSLGHRPNALAMTLQP
jgi:hypothetical protein